MAITLSEALIGGFRTFFSIWQLCIMQITPFYLAFFLGVYFSLQNKNTKSNFITMLLAAAGVAAGFSLVFALAGVPSTPIGNAILRNLKGLKFLSGIFILAAGFLMILFSVLTGSDARSKALVILSPLTGASFGIAYSPCIAPVLSRILNFAAVPGNSAKGILLLFLYGAGLSAAVTLIGIAFIIIHMIKAGRKTSRAIAPTVAASLVFMILGVLLVSGLMLRFKMFLVNLF